MPVATVGGRIEAAELGRTYLHEHVFVLTPDVQQNYPAEWGSEQARIEQAAGKLRALAAQGVRTIVDPTVVGLGRYLPRIQRVAARVPELNIVVATGCYTHRDLPMFFRYRPAGSADPMVQMFVGDICDGITGTGVRAGLLKCAIDRFGLTSGVERVMRAVTEAHHRTGTPIMVHTHPGTRTGLVVKRVVCDEGGVAPERVVLAHSGDTTDVDHLSELAELGFVLGMDRFGLYTATSLQARADTVVELCRRGYADRMVLSQDAACYLDWIAPEAMTGMAQWHYLHLGDEVLPYLREHGVSEQQLTTMLVDVPRRVLEPTQP